MKRSFLYVFLLIFIVGFLVWPVIGLGNDEKEIQLGNNATNFLLNIVQKKLYQKATFSFGEQDFEFEDGAAMTVIHKAVRSRMFSYFFQDVPKEVIKNLIKTTFKMIKLLYTQDISAVLGELEELTVEKAKEYLINYLLQNEIKVKKGELEYSYISYKGNIQKASFQYIITFRSLDDKLGQMAMEFYSLKTIEPPGLSMDTPCDLRDDLKPFILRVNGKLGEVSGGYYWIGEPEIEVVFDEPVPDLGFQEPSFFDKLKSRFQEIEIVFEKAVEMIKIIFGKVNLFQAALNPIVTEESAPGIDISEINLEDLLPIAEKIEEVEEKLTVGIGETVGRTSELTLDEIQKMLDEISERIDILTQNILKLAREQGINLLEEGFFQQEGIGQVVFSSTAPKAKSQDIEPEPESEPEPEEGALKDTTLPEVIFELEPIQTSLSFALAWTVTDPMDSVSPVGSGIDGFYLLYQTPNIETTSPSEEEGIALWYQDENEEWQDWLVGEILELGADRENLLVLGKDEYIYYFKIQAKDKAGNLSRWQEAATIIQVPKTISEHSWPMLRHDSQNTGRSSFAGPGNFPEPVLQVLIEGESFGPVSINRNGILYFMAQIDGEDGLYAFYPDGTKKWYFQIPLSSEPPLIAPDATIYILVPLNQTIIALNSEGELKWEKSFPDILAQNLLMSSQERIYFLANTLSSGIFPKLIALNPINGETIWAHETDKTSWIESLAVGPDKTIYFGQGDTLSALNSDGTKKWQRTFESKCTYYYCSPTVPIISITDNGTIYTIVASELDFVGLTDAGVFNCLHALNPENPAEQEEKWPAKCGRFNTIPLPISAQDSIYLTSSWTDLTGSLRTAISGFDSQGNDLTNWPLRFWELISSLIVDKEEIVYVLFGYYNNITVRAFSQQGEEKWSFSIPGVFASFSLGGDGTLFVSTNNNLSVIK